MRRLRTFILFSFHNVFPILRHKIVDGGISAHFLEGGEAEIVQGPLPKRRKNLLFASKLKKESFFGLG